MFSKMAQYWISQNFNYSIQLKKYNSEILQQQKTNWWLMWIPCLILTRTKNSVCVCKQKTKCVLLSLNPMFPKLLFSWDSYLKSHHPFRPKAIKHYWKLLGDMMQDDPKKCLANHLGVTTHSLGNNTFIKSSHIYNKFDSYLYPCNPNSKLPSLSEDRLRTNCPHKLY